MSNQDKGEHSRRSAPDEDEKPLKKARYVWEVKGKYHLKETYKNNNNTISRNNNTEPEGGNSNKGEDENVKLQEEESSTTSNKCCIESFLAKTEAIMENDVDEEDAPMNSNLDCNILKEIPVTLVSPMPRNQDYYLKKWQARQIARGFVDNTINTVLETWINPPFDASDFVENCANDGQVEDDAILMAIQSHGLQSNARGDGQLEFLHSHEEREISIVKNPQIEESTMDNFENYQNELIKEQENGSSSSNADSMSCDSSISNSGEGDGSLDMGDPMDFFKCSCFGGYTEKGIVVRLLGKTAFLLKCTGYFTALAKLLQSMSNLKYISKEN
ncbi:hypothetical protein NQ315_011533 [Exocentrus adspersus]|uniref:Uncharacterized protein n=1 Tax=Exocentrus adspersus TaxID=1586481 RepID=A0AAV8VUK0_9CUCU|nr:hypothetical protein NQ315_011533 [Exocentrus adspersus]